MGTELLVRSPYIRETYTQDGAVLLDIQRGTCFSINSVGAHIWQQIAAGHPLAVIAEGISRTFSIPYQQAWIDVSEFVQQLAEREMVRKPASEKTPRLGVLVWILRLCGRAWSRRNQPMGKV